MLINTCENATRRLFPYQKQKDIEVNFDQHLKSLSRKIQKVIEYKKVTKVYVVTFV